MRNIFLFFIITFLTGSPIIALLVIIGLYLVLDYQFIGISRRLMEGFYRNRTISSLERELSINPHDAAARSDLGRLLVEARRYPEAVHHLEKAMDRMADSEDTACDLGLAYLWTGKLQEGEALIRSVLDRNPKFRYGDPYLRWGEFMLKMGKFKPAIEVLEKLRSIHSSSVEGHYLLGEAYRRNGELQKAKEVYKTGKENFRKSPGYKRRTERVWIWKTRIRLLLG